METESEVTANLEDAWAAIDSPIYKVLTGGEHMYDARARRLDDKHWLYVDDSEGYKIIRSEDFELMTSNCDCTIVLV